MDSMIECKKNTELKQKKKKKKQKDGPLVEIESLPLFKQYEKKYRFYKNIETDFSKVWFEKELIENSEIINNSNYKILKLNNPQGVFIIKSYLNLEEQLFFSKKLLNEYHKKPHRTNLDQIKDDNSLLVNNATEYFFNNRIRWSNIGYQYDWTNRSYPEGKTSLPIELYELSEKTKKLFKDLINDIDQYFPESVIINYYSESDYMGGHLDDGEKDQDSPIMSFSIGCSCVFLLGGNDKSIEPIPVILESGDLIIMSGYSRTCYHGVPRIIEGSFDTNKFKLLQLNQEDTEYGINNDINALNYLNTHRLNFNFRRVFPDYLN